MTISELDQGRSNNFDFLRFGAALMVVFSHSFPLSRLLPEPMFATTKNQMTLGTMGVAIFFVLSGYLISASFVRKKSLGYFIKARALRLLPALSVVVLLSVFVMGPLVTTLKISDYFKRLETYKYLANISALIYYGKLPGVFASNAYKFAVNGSLWSIPFEVRCYIGLVILGMLGLLRKKWVIF